MLRKLPKPRNWWDDYTGLPFKLDGRDRSGVDCYGLVCLVYKDQLNIDLNPFTGIFVDKEPKTMLKISETMQKDRENWIRACDRINAFDMVQLRTGRHAFHVGIAINDKKILHIEEGINCVIEKLTDPIWKNRVEWIYRHPLMMNFENICRI